ncbi:MAG: neutral/alkaline non-lysosomal ceramidase N-terminal domain-containing protein [Terriglobia bacterium]
MRRCLLRYYLRQFSFILAVFLMPVGGRCAVMKAGVARVDITPPPGVRMWGYSNSSIATGTLDPLYARVLELELGERRLVWVDLDLGRTFDAGSLAELKEAVKRQYGINWLIVQAIHTHAGPTLTGATGQPPAWVEPALAKIEHAIGQAANQAQPVRLGTGYGVAYIGYNRRRVNPDGTITMIWNNAAQVPTAPVDPTVAVLRIDRMDGTPLAILVNYACHPVTFGPDNTQYSADFPGVMCKVVESAFRQQPLCFYIQGASGDINVYDGGTSVKDGAALRREWAGERLGKEVVRVAKQIQTHSASDPSLDFAEDPITFNFRWNPDAFRQMLVNHFGARYLPPIQGRMQLPVTTVLINKKIAIMGMPGEPFVEFQKTWRARCPVANCFFLGYANGYFGYFPTIKAASEGGYGAANATTWVQVGAGERMVNQAVTKIYQMLGLLQAAPRRGWKSAN